MSVAACGGGKRGSGDDDREQRGDEKKKRIGLAQALDFVTSSNEDEDKAEDNDEITNTKLNRRITVVRGLTAQAEAPRPLEKRISKSFDDLKGMGMEDGKELRAEDHPFNKKRILSIHVMSSLYKMSRAVAVPVHDRPKKEDQDDVVDKAEKKKKKKKKKMGNNSKNQKDGK